MNNIQKEIILYLKNYHYESQRIIASNLNISLGLVNKEIKSLINDGYLTEKNKLTEKANSMINNCKPKRAIILAAGICTRMVPINSSIPKALLSVNNEVIIEKQIIFLHDVGIKEIYIVVGYMKEKFEYLIDKYNVKLIVNPFYNTKNNYYSLYLIRNKLSNSYIIPSDIVMYKNPFSKYEIGAWYMFSDKKDTNSEFKINKNKSVSLSHEDTMHMIGIAYITSSEAKIIEEKLTSFVSKDVDDYFWEKALQNKNEFLVNQIEASALMKLRKYKNITDFAGYMENPKEAINNIEIYRKEYRNSGRITKSFLKDVRREKEDDNMVKTIYEYFKNYSREEVDKVLSTLSEESLELIRIRYGDDLTVPVNNKLTEEQRKKFYGSVMAQIKRLLENPDIKRRKVQKNEIEEKKIESTSIVENVQTKNNLVETNEEHTSKITKYDYINMIKLFKTSNFKQMISNLGSKESIIISLRMGYIDGKYFSVDAIAEFLDIERDEVSKIIKEVLLNYKESVIKSIDHAIEVASDEQNVLKDEKDIKEKKYRKI